MTQVLLNPVLRVLMATAFAGGGSVFAGSMKVDVYKDGPRLLLAFFACMLMLVAPLKADLVSTFDTDLEGWSGQLVVVTHIASGGNPGGYLQANDLPNTSFLRAPAAFLGDLTAFDGGTLSFDLKIFSTDLPPAGAGGNVTLRSGPAAVTRNVIPLPTLPVPSPWTSGAILLTASAWGIDQAAWLQLLSNVTAIEIVVDPSFGANDLDITGFDNFRLAPVPEPATMLVVAIALLGAVARARRIS